MAKKKRKYTPPCEWMDSDDFAIADVEGQEHYPHQGERVQMRQDSPWLLMQITAGMPNDQYAKLIVQALKRQILDWEWTDDFGDPLPRPEDPEAFEQARWALSNEERGWLLDKVWKPARLKNA